MSGQRITTEEAARLLGVKPVTIRSYIKRGYLTPTKYGRDWFYPLAEVEALRTNMPKPGTPKRKQ